MWKEYVKSNKDMIYPMQYEIPVTKLKSAKGHGHPALNISW